VRRFVAWGILGIAVGVSCGGRTPGPEADGGGGPTGSGNGAGGAGGTGGTTAGGTTTGTGGTTAGGTTAGTGGATVGGTGGTGTTGGAGGVGGTGGTGGGVDPAFDVCTGAGQCELVSATCCSCGTLGLGQLSPINSSKRDAFSKQVCSAMPQPCPPCIGMVDPHLAARCESGRCRGFDIRTDPTYTKCGSDQECTLRNGLGCCECGAPSGGSDWVAISHLGRMLLAGQVCAPGSVCPACIPIPPANTVARCLSGTCQKSPPSAAPP
jgi:hypothetical protein